jgi:hypothetical protein
LKDQRASCVRRATDASVSRGAAPLLQFAQSSTPGVLVGLRAPIADQGGVVLDIADVDLNLRSLV